MAKATGASKADTAVKLVLIFFISLLSFTVGTLVGGQFEKSKSHQMTLEMEEGAELHSQQDMAGADAAPITDEDLEGLEEYVKANRHVASEQTAPKAEENRATETAAGKDGYTHASRLKEAPAAAASTPATTTSDSAHPSEKAAERLANDQAPVADPKKVKTPDQTLPMVASSTIGKFTVQVASYAKEKEAEAHATKLKEKGFNAFYIPATVNGKTWYRVSVGRFTDQKTAMAYRKELLDSQAASSAIVQKVVQ